MKRTVRYLCLLAAATPATLLSQTRPARFEGAPTYEQLQPSQGVNLGFGAPRIATLDLDGDGLEEAARVSAMDGEVSILTPRRNRFALQTSLALPANTSAADVVLGDFDGDGNGDVIALSHEISPSPGTVFTIFPGTGTGSFGSSFVLRVPERLEHAITADVDADGRADVLSWSQTLQTLVLVFGGSATGGSRITRTTLQGRIGNVVAADLDGDLDLDVACSLSAGVIQLLLGDGSGTLTLGSRLAVPNGTGGLLAEDMDADGDIDLIATSSSTAAGTSFVAHANQGNGQFGTPMQSMLLPDQLFQTALKAADVNGDSTLDIVFGGSNGTLGSLLSVIGDGSLGFRTRDILPLAAFDFEVLDLSNNVSLELVTGDVRVLPILRDGSFGGVSPAELRSISPAMTGGARAFFDLDGDRTTDLVQTDPINSTLRLFTSTGEGTFRPERTVAVSSVHGYLAFDAELNGDGWPDLLTISGGSVIAFLNDTRGSFGNAVTTTTGPVGFRAAVADLDGDALDDVILTERRTSAGMLLFARGDGSFDTMTYTFTCAPGDVALFDVDQDGRRDIIFGDRCNGRPSFARNLGNRVFDPIRPLSNSPQQGVNLVPADLDGDGTLELVTLSSATLSVFARTLTGTWSLRQNQSTAPFQFQGLLRIDTDGDGRDEVLLSGSSNSRLTALYAAAPRTVLLSRLQLFSGALVGEGRTSGLQNLDVNADGYPDLAFEGTSFPSNVPTLRIYPNVTALHADASRLVRAGRTPLDLNAGTGAAGDLYAMFVSSVGTYPGIPYPPARFYPLNRDPVLTASVLSGGGGFFNGFSGTLDGRGNASAEVVIPAMAALSGVSLSFAYLTFDPLTQLPEGHSNAFTLVIE